MTTPYNWEDEDGDPDPHKGDGSPSASELIERAKAARNDAYSAVQYMVERYGVRGLATLVNVIDEEYDTYSDIILERKQVENYVFERYNLYVPDLWDDLIDSEEFREMVFQVRDYTAKCIPDLVRTVLEDNPAEEVQDD